MLWRYHLRTLFSPWHLAALALLTGIALAWPVSSTSDRYFLRWYLTRSEWFGAPVLMAMASSLLQVQGQVDERWGTVPPGFAGLFLQRWLLVLGYFAAALGLFLALAGPRAGDFSWWRTFPSVLTTAALFSLAGPLVHHRTGSAATGWAAGLALYFAAIVVAGFWCPKNSVYQLWLPFAGLSDATPAALAVSKAVYGLGALGLLAANLAALRRPERLVGRSD